MPEEKEEKKTKIEREELRALRSQEVVIKKEAMRSEVAHEIKEGIVRSQKAEGIKKQAQKESKKESKSRKETKSIK